jgi:hypothetical protein
MLITAAIGSALAGSLQLGAGVQSTEQFAGNADGPTVLLRTALNPRVLLSGSVAVNALPRRVHPIDQVYAEILVGSSDAVYVLPRSTDLASARLGLDAGPVAFGGQAITVGPRVHAGIEPRWVQTRYTAVGIADPATTSALRLGAYAGLGGEVWLKERVGLRLAWTARPYTSPEQYFSDIPATTWGFVWTNSRSLELMVSL